MRYPKGLKENGTIGFVAPSFGCATQPYKAAFEAALGKWTKQGYRLKLGPNCFVGEGIGISNTPIKCAQELMDGYVDTQSDVLISCGGGELMCETISHVDFSKINEATPKWFMGYSDNTNFTFLLNTICDVASIYGPCAATFGMEDEHKTLRDAFSILTAQGGGEKLHFDGYDKWEMVGIKDEEHPLAGYNLDTDSYVKVYVGDGKEYEHAIEASNINMEGRLIGGCLDILVNICGTRFDKVTEFNDKYKDDGIIWFLESCDLNMLSYRRAMWELDEAGWFTNAKGFIIGRPLHFGENIMGLDQYKAVYDVLSKYKVPIIMDADLGHLPPAIPIISGSMATVRAGEGKWEIDMEFK